MSDDLTEPQNSLPEESFIPPSSQDPTEPAPENTAQSEPSSIPPEAPESPRNVDEAIPVNNDNSTPNDPEAISTEPETRPEIEEKPTSQTETAQTPVNEPLENKSKSSFARELLISARNAIQFRKRKKLDRVMSLFLQHSKITNDEVEKFLHVSDATATRYLSILEKEGKIKQTGKTGKGVSYSRI